MCILKKLYLCADVHADRYVCVSLSPYICIFTALVGLFAISGQARGCFFNDQGQKLCPSKCLHVITNLSFKSVLGLS